MSMPQPNQPAPQLVICGTDTLGVGVNIPIRTVLMKGRTAYVQAGAGIVADSVPELEWKETEHKARAVLRASELVEEGLQ